VEVEVVEVAVAETVSRPLVPVCPGIGGTG
jgi:hypothetical protein